MDINQVIQELSRERDKLDALIRILEHGLDRVPARAKKSTRGRKSMAADERSEVAERMRRYWAARKGTNGVPHPPTVSPPPSESLSA